MRKRDQVRPSNREKLVTPASGNAEESEHERNRIFAQVDGRGTCACSWFRRRRDRLRRSPRKGSRDRVPRTRVAETGGSQRRTQQDRIRASRERSSTKRCKYFFVESCAHPESNAGRNAVGPIFSAVFWTRRTSGNPAEPAGAEPGFRRDRKPRRVRADQQPRGRRRDRRQSDAFGQARAESKDRGYRPEDRHSGSEAGRSKFPGDYAR